MLPECKQERYGAPEAEAQQGGVFVGCSTGGAAGSSGIHDRLDPDRIISGNTQRYTYEVRAGHKKECTQGETPRMGKGFFPYRSNADSGSYLFPAIDKTLGPAFVTE